MKESLIQANFIVREFVPRLNLLIGEKVGVQVEKDDFI